MVPKRRSTFVVLVVLAGVIPGCQSPASRRERLNSTYAPTRARAVVQSAEAGDATAIHKLVDLLEDEDRGVRMYSIVALRRLCGEDYGYRYYDSESERQLAVERWRQAIRDGDVRLVGNRGRSESPNGETLTAQSSSELTAGVDSSGMSPGDDSEADR